MFNLLDALLSEGSVSSFAMLSQAEQFQRKWPSLYAAVEDGRLNEVWLRKFLAQQVPKSGYLLLCSGWLALAATPCQNLGRSPVCLSGIQ